MKVTQWFDGGEFPAREGVYQCDYSGEVGYSLYSNLFWRRNADTPEEAERQHKFSGWQNVPWRGLAEKP